VLRFLLWRLLGVLAAVEGFALLAWLLHGGLGRLVRRSTSPGGGHLVSPLAGTARALWSRAPAGALAPVMLVTAVGAALAVCLAFARRQARRRRRYVRLRVAPYRTDRASAEAVVTMFEALHKRLLRRWWRRLLSGQPGVALEVHHWCSTAARSRPRERDHPQSGARTQTQYGPGGPPPVSAFAWMAVTCPRGSEKMVEAALRGAYPNCCLQPMRQAPSVPPVVVRLKKAGDFIKRVGALEHFEQEREPPVNRLLTAMGACGEPALVQLALTPAPAFLERLAKRVYKRHEARLSRERREHLAMRDRSMVEDTELRGGLDVQHRSLFFMDLRVAADSREACLRIASELRARRAENRLVERGTDLRHGLLTIYGRRLQRGEGNPLPPFHKGVYASTELASLWQLPSSDYMTVPFARNALPLAPAPPSIMRPRDGSGTLRDALGAVSIHPDLRKQNTAVPGAVEQGKTSYLIATVAEDLRRERCAVIVLDPKGDAADAAISLVPPERTCTLLDFARPTCGFNPLAVDAPADVIADYVVAALKNLFDSADIRASSDRYLRNAVIAVLAYDRRSTLWDAARLLSVGEEGYSYRRTVGAHVRALPEVKEISEFFTAELVAQLADSRSTTTAKLDAPVNKLARLLNSASIKRVLLNDALRVDFERIIAGREVLVVKGALGAMGAGNTSVLMQLLVGMLDAALARQQDLLPAHERVAVALKVDEAPLVLNRGFAETMALKRSAGLETVACWQADAQWTDVQVRDQLDALFAHRVYFATASTRDARAAAGLTMTEFSDTVRPRTEHLSSLGHPDVRLRLPKHHAIASWTTPDGRQSPFIAQTIPLRVDQQRLRLHAARQIERGGHHHSDLRQPHWDCSRGIARSDRARQPREADTVSTRVRAGDGRAERLPATPAESYRELVELDRAHSVRWAKRLESPVALDPDRLDLEVLALISSMRHVLTSQLHRRFNPERAVTTTQRRLKRLSDAGLVERFQFYRRDGGGVPMCYVITAAGVGLLAVSGRLQGQMDDRAGTSAPRGMPSRTNAERRLRQARHDAHVSGWALALARLDGGTWARLRGPAESVLSPPSRSTHDGKAALSPGELRLPGARAPHDFIRTAADGERVEVERFETIRPDATVELPSPEHDPESDSTPAPAIDVLVELDDRLPVGRTAAKLERYDHFLAGWSAHTARYGRRLDAVPLVAFVCRDRARARRCATHADPLLRACRAYAGEYPADWEYPGRDLILFVSERDLHEGLARAYGVPRLPPAVRVSTAGGDPHAGEARAEPREIPAMPRPSGSRRIGSRA
jgi:Replication-relaxation